MTAARPAVAPAPQFRPVGAVTVVTTSYRGRPIRHVAPGLPSIAPADLIPPTNLPTAPACADGTCPLPRR